MCAEGDDSLPVAVRAAVGGRGRAIFRPYGDAGQRSYGDAQVAVFLVVQDAARRHEQRDQILEVTVPSPFRRRLPCDRVAARRKVFSR